MESGEECDDGNAIPGDGCSLYCTREQASSVFSVASVASLPPIAPRSQLAASSNVVSCGNGILEFGEECDDGNIRDFDGCTSDCRLEIGICGDGIVQSLLSEQCEQALFDSSLPYQCIRCRFVSQFCGDGKLDPGEECDGGIRNSNAPVTLSLSKGDVACRLDCSLPRCGDGILDAVEECDPPSLLRSYGRAGGCDRFCRREQSAAPAFILPYQIPGQQLEARQLPQQTAETGPELLAIMAAGAAGGLAFMRRRRR